MTAIGFICVLVAFLAGWVDGFVSLPEWLAKIMGVVAVCGAICLIGGVTTWMWRVMP